MRVVVTGGRDYDNRARAFAVLDFFHRQKAIEVVIHGACGWDADILPWDPRKLRGADRLAELWAQDRKVPSISIPARWSILGEKAGRIRNGKLLDELPNYVVAFPGGDGTINCVYQALSRGIRVFTSPFDVQIPFVVRQSS